MKYVLENKKWDTSWKIKNEKAENDGTDKAEVILIVSQKFNLKI
jgi:hypothetical protein